MTIISKEARYKKTKKQKIKTKILKFKEGEGIYFHRLFLYSE